MLREGEAGGEVPEICRREGISRETFYRWRRKYGGLEVSEARKLKALEEESRRLKRIVAEQALNLQVLKDVLGKGSLTTGGAAPGRRAGASRGGSV